MKPVRPINVLVFGIFGLGRPGGVDRLMDAIHQQLEEAPIEGVNATFLTARGAGSISVAPFHMAVSLFRLFAARLRGKVDLVHLNVASYGSTYRKIVVAWAARLLRTPYLIHLHSGKYPDFYRESPRLVRRAIEAMFARSSGIVVLGAGWARFVSEQIGPPGRPIYILPNASKAPQTPRRERPADVVHIVFLGVVTASKGVYDLLAALRRLAEAGVAFRATLAGNGEVDSLRTKVADHALEGQVEVPGWLGPESVDRLLKEADVLVLPSYWENLPMVVVEGFAYGVTVVATPVGAVPDLVEDGRTGVLVPVGDTEALYRALKRLAADGELRQRLGETARKVHAERLAIGPYVAQLANIWRELAGRPEG